MPLKVNTAPYGLISKIQACKLNAENPRRSCLKIIKVLKDSQFKESIIDCLLRGLEEACNFADATKVIEELKGFESLKKEQINHIIRIAIRNNQVRLCNAGIIFLRSIIEEHTSKIDPFLIETYNKIKGSF